MANAIGLGEVGLPESLFAIRAQLTALRVRTVSLPFFRRLVVRRDIDRVLDHLARLEDEQRQVVE